MQIDTKTVQEIGGYCVIGNYETIVWWKFQEKLSK